MKKSRALRPQAFLPLVARLGVIVLLAIPGAAWAGQEPAVGIFSDVHVGKGEVRHDDLVCIGGTATVEGKVEGDVVVIMGKLVFSGEAHDVVTILSDTRLEEGAVVGGDGVHVLGRLARDPSVRVAGDMVDVGSRLPPRVQRLFARGLVGVLILLRIVSLVVSFVLILIVVLLAPARIERMSHALEPRWPASVGFGLLGYVIGIALVIGLAITLIGIPLAGLLLLAVKVLGLMGVAAILMVIGKKVGSGSGLIGPDPSVLASVVVGFALVGLVRFVPIIGELAWFVISVVGLGLALVTKIGSPSGAAA